MSQLIIKSWRCVLVRLWKRYYSFHHTMCFTLHSSLTWTSLHEKVLPLIMSIAGMFIQEFYGNSYENFCYSFNVLPRFCRKYSTVYDNTFIILKQNERRRIINNIARRTEISIQVRIFWNVWIFGTDFQKIRILNGIFILHYCIKSTVGMLKITNFCNRL